MKILLIGGSGQLGSDLLRNNRDFEIVAPGRDRLDLERLESAAGLMTDLRPDLVVNCAAFHNVSLCEEQAEMAFRVNCVAVRNLAALCVQYGARFLTFSTDYVFGGEQRAPYREEDRPGPLQIYGISRLAGEYAALSAAPENAVIVRTCGLYGRAGSRSRGGNFVDHRIADAHAGKSTEISCDQTVCPTSTDDLSKALLKLIGQPGLAGGIYHLVNEGECTWYEFTKSIFAHIGTSTELRPVDRHGRTGTMRRPLYSVLANTRGRALGVVLPLWQDALKRYLATNYPA